MYVGFMEFSESYDRVNAKVLQLLRMYDVNGKLWNGIKSIHVNIIACIKVKGGESECLRINRGVRQGCIISSLVFNVDMDVVMKEVKMGWRGWELCFWRMREWSWHIIIIRQHSKVLYRWRVRRRGKSGKHTKVGVKRKWWVVALPPHSPQGNGRQVSQGGTIEPGG